MKFFEGAPLFAVEVRSEYDRGPRAEEEIARKIADYFAAGTRVVWDVDLLSDEVVRVHRAGEAGKVTVYRRGEVAEAEPALPGWRLPVDDLFPQRQKRLRPPARQTTETRDVASIVTRWSPATHLALLQWCQQTVPLFPRVGSQHRFRAHGFAENGFGSFGGAARGG